MSVKDVVFLLYTEIGSLLLHESEISRILVYFIGIGDTGTKPRNFLVKQAGFG